VRQQVSEGSASARPTGRKEIAVQHTFKVFAPIVLAWAHDTGADLAKTNVNGGAIAIGHPLGASGARIMTTLVNALEQRGGRYGLQTMCEGGGMANATIIERLS
jgi:acetyl-CoA acyltransferase